jgi:hypothetical protein
MEKTMKLMYLAIAVTVVMLSGCNMVKQSDGTYLVNDVGKDGGGACHGRSNDGKNEFCIPKVSSEACYTTYAKNGYNLTYAEGGECKSAW